MQNAQGFGTARHTLRACGKSKTPGQFLEEFKSPHIESQNLASWNWEETTWPSSSQRDPALWGNSVASDFTKLLNLSELVSSFIQWGQ